MYCHRKKEMREERESEINELIRNKHTYKQKQTNRNKQTNIQKEERKKERKKHTNKQTKDIERNKQRDKDSVDYQHIISFLRFQVLGRNTFAKLRPTSQRQQLIHSLEFVRPISINRVQMSLPKIQ